MDATFAALYFGVALQVHNIVNFNVNSLSYSWSSVISIIYLLFLSHFITFCFLETFVLALFSLLFQQAEFFIQLCFSRIGMSQPILYSRQKFPCFAFFSVPVFFWEWAINQVAYCFFYRILSLLQVASMHSICSQDLQSIFTLRNIPLEVWIALKLAQFGCVQMSFPIFLVQQCSK